MAKIKHTKNEMKAQREALTRFDRFLPMLQLKKQQLQAEIQAIDAKMTERKAAESKIRDELRRWVRLFSESFPSEDLIKIDRISTEEGNIAGVAIPILTGLTLHKPEVDLFASPSWHDDAIATLESLVRLRVELDILKEQRRLVAEELRTTSQRVNLFEKVKIPECKENIRVIKIFLGDQQTAGVVRGKFAKARTIRLVEAGEGAPA